MCERYSQFIVNYVIEWEKVINTRTSADLKKNHQLRTELDHYEAKVESLRQSVNITMAKNKVVNPKITEQLNRNETKLTESRLQYDKFSTNLTAMLDELTSSCWKDLHPLMVKLSQFDITTANDQATSFAQLKDVMDNLKSVSSKTGLKGEDRLQDIASQDIEILGAPSLRNAIENNPNSNPYSSSGVSGGSYHSTNILDHDPLSSDMGSLSIGNDPYAPSSDFISSYNNSQHGPPDDFTNPISAAPITSAPSNDLLNMDDPPSTVAPPYAPPPNPPVTSSIFDMPSDPNPHAYRRTSSTSQPPPQNSQLSVFESQNTRRDSSNSGSYMAPYQPQRQDSFGAGPAPSSYNSNSWQNQSTSQPPSWQQNQPPSLPSSTPYSAPQQSYQPSNPSWQQNQPNNALAVSSNQPSNQWSSSMTAPNYQPPPQKQSYNQQYQGPPTQGPPGGQWNYNQQSNMQPMGGPPPPNMPAGSLSSMAPNRPQMPPGPPPPSMSQIPSYNRQNSGNPF